MSDDSRTFNPPPGWPKPPPGWTPPKGWEPDPAWPPPPEGWQLWTPTSADGGGNPPDPPKASSETPKRPPALSGMDSRPVAQATLQPPTRLPTAEKAVHLDRLSSLEAENAKLRARLASLPSNDDTVLLDDESVLQSVGIYRYHHPLENASAYKEQLRCLSERIASLVKAKKAIVKSNMFTFDNSLAKGRRMTADLSKLMLRAYNAEADNALRTLRAGNVVTAKKRLEASRATIAKLGKMMEMHISDEFHALRFEELELTSDFLMMKQEEKEAAREERARLREERKVAAELAAEREKLDKERAHLENAIASLHNSGGSDPDLEARLAKIDEVIAQNDYRAANVRAGYVYVISNRGAFGPDVVKIGMTRRLEPVERITELSGASVPFRFDVHALFFSEDAVTLENELHKAFADRRLNHANGRKEFFFAHPTEVREVLISKVGNLLEFVERAESTEYLQSVDLWPERQH